MISSELVGISSELVGDSKIGHPKGWDFIGLKLWRESEGLIQAEVSEALGIPESTISKWENGNRCGYSREELRKRALGKKVGKNRHEIPGFRENLRESFLALFSNQPAAVGTEPPGNKKAPSESQGSLEEQTEPSQAQSSPAAEATPLPEDPFEEMRARLESITARLACPDLSDTDLDHIRLTLEALVNKSNDLAWHVNDFELNAALGVVQKIQAKIAFLEESTAVPVDTLPPEKLTERSADLRELRKLRELDLVVWEKEVAESNERKLFLLAEIRDPANALLRKTLVGQR